MSDSDIAMPPNDEPRLFRTGVTWNMGAFALMAVCGGLLNILIAVFYDAAALGVFNQVFAAYIVYAQLAVGGVHHSVQRHVAALGGNPTSQGTTALAAMTVCLITASIFGPVMWLSAEPIASMLASADVAEGIRWAAPGLSLFALNKVLLGILNGQRRMRGYAIAQGLRPLAMTVLIGIAGFTHWPAARLTGILTAAEAMVLLVALPAVWPTLRLAVRPLGEDIRRHVRFGLKGFSSGILVELNTRIDVLMLGLWMNDSVVGVYSFAALLVEGFSQLLVVLRVNYNPRLAELLHHQAFDLLKQTVRQGVRRTYGVMTLVGIAGIAAFPLTTWLAGGQIDPTESWRVFAILMTGLILASGHLPFGQILLQADRPGTHTIMMGGVVIFNAAANIALIPVWGAAGAAAATAAAFVVQAITLRMLTTRTTGSIF